MPLKDTPIDPLRKEERKLRKKQKSCNRDNLGRVNDLVATSIHEKDCGLGPFFLICSAKVVQPISCLRKLWMGCVLIVFLQLTCFVQQDKSRRQH